MRSKISGFTLVELVVGMAIASIIMLATAGVLIFGNRAFQYYALSRQADKIGDSVVSLMQERLLYAEELVIDQGRRREETGSIGFCTDGTIWLEGEKVYGGFLKEGFSFGCRLTLLEEAYSLQIEVYLEDRRGNVRYRSKETMELINMRLKNTSIDSNIEAWEKPVDSKNQDIFFYPDSGQRCEKDE